MFYICACLLISLIVFSVFVSRPGINGYERAMFGEVVYGTAYKP